MKDIECVEFLQWCLPLLRMRWAGFRKVRKQVCKRIVRRFSALGLKDPQSYKDYIVAHPEELQNLDPLCRVTISRFYRDRGQFDIIRTKILPSLATIAETKGLKRIRCWSAGSASGEEAYTLQILWKLCIASKNRPVPYLNIIATDTDEILLDRAREGCFQASSLKDLPEELKNRAFDHAGDMYAIKKDFQKGIEFIKQDIRKNMPDGVFQLILCRNFVFTYYEEALQRELIRKIEKKLVHGGFLLLGIHEKLPLESTHLIPSRLSSSFYEKH